MFVYSEVVKGLRLTRERIINPQTVAARKSGVGGQGARKGGRLLCRVQF